MVTALKWSSVKRASYQQKDTTERLIKSETKSVKVINGSRAKHIHDNNKHLTAGLCFRAEILNTEEWGEMSHFSLNPDTTNGQQTYKWSSFFSLFSLIFPPELFGSFHISHWALVRPCIKTKLMPISAWAAKSVLYRRNENKKKESWLRGNVCPFCFK